MNLRRRSALALALALALITLLAAASVQPAAAHDGASSPEEARQEFWLPAVFVDYQNLVVDPKYREGSRDFYRNVYLASEDVPHAWSGDYESCDPGDTSRQYKATVRLRVNYFRAMAGVPADISLSPELNRMVQAAALIMSRNDELSHYPPTEWACHSAGGALAANHSNLYLGHVGALAVSGYIEDEGENNYKVGHRRWILCPQSRTFGTGDVPGTPDYRFWPANALWVVDSYHYYDPRPATRDEFVAWPPPGYVPGPVVFPRWSFSYDDADFTEATVHMTANGADIAVRLEPLAYNCCENTLVWIPDIDFATLDLAQDRSFKVSVRDVWMGGMKRSFDYTVTVFDPE
ncbi:MAG: CAP domain-containing protein [Chloroflexota bacterium]|nr:CAP domain-containing protein [Chloroflexota bacterium]